MKNYKLSIPYTGTKNKLLDFVIPKLNKANCDTLISPFSGSLAVEMNSNCNKFFLNDSNTSLIELYKAIKYMVNSPEQLFNFIRPVIDKYNLNDFDKGSYLDFREDYNNISSNNSDYDALCMKSFCLLILILHSFNNQIRFNKRGEFNMPFGFRTLNSSNEEKITNLVDFIINNSDIVFTSVDFNPFICNMLNHNKDNADNTIFYLDPPYNNTVATYNENNWSDLEEEELYELINEINNKGFKFLLSNVIEHNGIKNDKLLKFVEENNYKIITKEYNYGNCSYQKKNKSKSIECLISNY